VPDPGATDVRKLTDAVPVPTMEQRTRTRDIAAGLTRHTPFAVTVDVPAPPVDATPGIDAHVVPPSGEPSKSRVPVQTPVTLMVVDAAPFRAPVVAELAIDERAMVPEAVTSDVAGLFGDRVVTTAGSTARGAVDAAFTAAVFVPSVSFVGQAFGTEFGVPWFDPPLEDPPPGVATDTR
jgi:hypothetical protein